MFVSQSERADTVTCALGRHGKTVRRRRFYIENINYGSHQLHYNCTLQLKPAELSTRYQLYHWKASRCNTAKLWHNLKFCNIGVLCKSQTESHLNHHYYFPSAWRLVPDGGNFCKTYSIVLTICGKIYEILCENYHATLTFLPTDQSFKTINFEELA